MGKIIRIALILCLLFVGFTIGKKMSFFQVRHVKTSRIETCLALYKDYRNNENQQKLSNELTKIGLTPLDFQKIIDRLIYYRTKQSSAKQAMGLLKAFRMGYDIKLDNVVSISGMDSEAFRLDAEILAVFEKDPELIEDAFKG